MSDPPLSAPPQEDHRRGLKPPQFGVVALLLFTTSIAILLAIFQSLGPLWAGVITLLALAVVAHVAGNAIGTRLRDEGSQPVHAVQEAGPKTAESHHFAPTTQLSQKKRIGWPTLVISAMFALAGATGGGALLAHFNWNRLTVANLTLSVVSCGVLGGLWGFWLCSFAKVALHAWQEALRHESSGHVSATPGIDQVLRSQPPKD